MADKKSKAGDKEIKQVDPPIIIRGSGTLLTLGLKATTVSLSEEYVTGSGTGRKDYDDKKPGRGFTEIVFKKANKDVILRMDIPVETASIHIRE
jgi:hypothetical protein